VALNNAALVTGFTAIKNEVTHLQLHSAAPDAGYTTNQIGSRVAVTGAVSAAGVITWASVAFTGLPANSPVWGVSYWTASTGGNNRGGSARTAGSDAAANAAGAYTMSQVTETPTAA